MSFLMKLWVTNIMVFVAHLAVVVVVWLLARDLWAGLVYGVIFNTAVVVWGDMRCDKVLIATGIALAAAVFLCFLVVGFPATLLLSAYEAGHPPETRLVPMGMILTGFGLGVFVAVCLGMGNLVVGTSRHPRVGLNWRHYVAATPIFGVFLGGAILLAGMFRR